MILFLLFYLLLLFLASLERHSGYCLVKDELILQISHLFLAQIQAVGHFIEGYGRWPSLSVTRSGLPDMGFVAARRDEAKVQVL